MRKRTIVKTLAVAGVLYLAKFALTMAGELRRYDHLRSLSNEGPVMQEAPEITMQVVRGQRLIVKEWIMFFKSLPKDVARYVKIESM